MLYFQQGAPMEPKADDWLRSEERWTPWSLFSRTYFGVRIFLFIFFWKEASREQERIETQAHEIDLTEARRVAQFRRFTQSVVYWSERWRLKEKIVKPHVPFGMRKKKKTNFLLSIILNLFYFLFLISIFYFNLKKFEKYK